MSALSGHLVPLIGALLTVTVTAISQTCLKLGMDLLKGSSVGPDRGLLEIALALTTNPFVIAGLFGYLLSTLLWLYVLSHMDLSMAYPFIGLSIVLTSLIGVFYLGEPSSASKSAGVLFVCLGVILVSRS